MDSRPNRILALVVGLLLLVGVIAAVVSANRQSTSYDKDSPVGVVQAYTAAMVAGHHDEALRYLGDTDCTIDDLDQTWVAEDVRIVLRDDSVDGDTAEVQVDVVMPSGDPLGGSEYTEKHTFRLSKSTGQWLISGSPWPTFSCGMEK